MSKITKRWLSTSLQDQLTGMQGDIISLEAGLTGANKNIAGLTGAINVIEWDIAGLTGAVNNLATYIYSLSAIDVGFSPVTGAGSTNVQGAIEALVFYVNDSVTGISKDAGLTGVQGQTGLNGPTGGIGLPGATGAFGGPQGTTGWQGQTGLSIIGTTGLRGVTGLVGITGAFGGPPGSTGPVGPTGAFGGPQGDTGLIGQTGPIGQTGFTGAQGFTGLQILMDNMLVERALGITGLSPTGISFLDYLPITGLNTSVTLTRSGKILSLLSLSYKNTSVGSQTVSYLLQSDGETGPFFSEYLSDNREKSEVMYQVTSNLPIGTHIIQAYWKTDSVGKQTQIISGNLSSIVLEGAYGTTGAQGITGTGTVGVTGAFGGPKGATGAQGITGLRGFTGLNGLVGATGPGLASFEKFVKILPMESWRAFNVDFDVFGDIPVLKFDSVGSEKIDSTIVMPVEWNGAGDINLKLGAILNNPLSAGAQLSLRLSYKGFNKNTNVGTLTPYYTDTVTKTYTSPAQYDFSEFEFTINRNNVIGNDYLHLIVEKLVGSPDVSNMGICSSCIEHGVTVGVGPTGPIGSTGLIGLTGIIGDTGIQGIKGVTGLQGYTGFIGTTGPIGNTGIQGIEGVTGLQGETGTKGDTGIVGAVGPTGAFGGPQGDTGLSGPTGWQGLTGLPGAGFTGLDGVTGLIGVTGAFGGPQGDTGLPGPTGWQGLTGLPGIQGYIGDTGLYGPTGYIGLQGYTGIQGYIGDTGLPGSTGWQGIQGITGIQGDIGYTGIRGLTGAQGNSGETGLTGTLTNQPFYNTVSRYSMISTSGEEVWGVSSSTVFVGLSWTRSSTVLTIYNSGHGHALGDRVIVRDTNIDYQVGLINTIDPNYFTIITASSGGTSGSSGAYSLGFTYTHDGAPKTGGTLISPSGAHADCQLISLRIRTGGRSSSTYLLAVPENAVNGAGANTSLGDCYMPDFNVRADADTLSAIAATMVVNNGSIGYEFFTFGALGTLSRFICLHF